MKRLWITASCALLLLGLAGFVACDESDSTSTAGTTFEKMEMSFTYEVSDDLLALADLSLVATAPDGADSTDVLTQRAWSRQFVGSEIPTGFSVQVKAALKEGVELTKDRYVVAYTWIDEFKEYRSNGKVHWHQKPDKEHFSKSIERSNSTPEVFKAEIEAAIALLNRTFSYVVTAEEDGTGYDVEDND